MDKQIFVFINHLQAEAQALIIVVIFLMRPTANACIKCIHIMLVIDTWQHINSSDGITNLILYGNSLSFVFV